MLSPSINNNPNNPLPSSNMSLLIKSIRGWLFIPLHEIIRCEADGNYSTVVLANGQRLTTCQTLKSLQTQLPQHVFIRVHQSHLVNTSFIRQITTEHYIELSNLDLVPVSRRKWKEVFQRMRYGVSA